MEYSPLVLKMATVEYFCITFPGSNLKLKDNESCLIFQLHNTKESWAVCPGQAWDGDSQSSPLQAGLNVVFINLFTSGCRIILTLTKASRLLSRSRLTWGSMYLRIWISYWQTALRHWKKNKESQMVLYENFVQVMEKPEISLWFDEMENPEKVFVW